jgi:YihY family inner membrane protein
MLEDAIAIIFHQPDVDQHGRSIWVSALLPYVYVLVLGVALLIVSVVSAAMDAISEHTIALLGVSLPLRSVPAFVLELSGFIGLTLLFTSIYKVLPVVRIAIRRALVGGFTAAVLWEIIRFGVAYWFANVSLVNVVYGSFATIIVVLLSLEIGAVILLLGAQVIAELESSAAAGLPWYVDRRESRGDPFEPD